MAQPTQNSSSGSSPNTTPVIAIIIAWLWVGIPLAWGVMETIKKTMQLFQ